MKKIAGKIAMILILVMLANSFASCFTINAIKDGEHALAIPLYVLLDVFIIAVAVVVVGIGVMLGEAPSETETGIYLASAENNPLTDFYSVMELFNSLPETERMAFMEKLNALPAEKLAYLISTVNSLPQTEITASIERLNALSETELSSAVQDFNALSETELDVLADKLNEKANSLPETDYVVVAAVSP